LGAKTKADPNTRDKIIDTREITREAGVPLGLMSYYFGTKGDLYSEVILRRAEDHTSAIRASMRQAAAEAGDQPAGVAALIRAYFAPLVERSLHSGPGWKAYIQLLSRAANTSRSEPYVAAFNDTYSPVVQEFIGLLKDHFPDADEADIYWSYYFLSSAIVHILVESGDVDLASDGKYKSSDLETIMDKMGPFFEAGITRLANPTEQPGS